MVTSQPKRSKARPRAARSTARPRTKPVLNVAMVGHSFMGRAHSNAMRQVGHFFELPFRIVPKVVVGRSLERVEAARDQFGFEEASDDLDAVLARDDIDLVDVATPNDTHAPISMAALRAGKHVMCEKPLAMDLKEARAMAALRSLSPAITLRPVRAATLASRAAVK